MHAARYTSEVGRKFFADGTAREFPGNTVVCMADAGQPAYQFALQIQEQLRQLPFAHKFAFLPPDSFHMTVIELLCDQVRIAERWSRFLPLDTPLAETDRFFIETVTAVSAPEHFSMAYQGLWQWPGIVVGLGPADNETKAAIRHYRDAIAAASGVRLPDHQDYQFHMSLSYLLIELEPHEADRLGAVLLAFDDQLRRSFGTLVTGRPELVFFDDMTRFVPIDQYHSLRSRT